MCIVITTDTTLSILQNLQLDKLGWNDEEEDDDFCKSSFDKNKKNIPYWQKITGIK